MMLTKSFAGKFRLIHSFPKNLRKQFFAAAFGKSPYGNGIFPKAVCGDSRRCSSLVHSVSRFSTVPAPAVSEEIPTCDTSDLSNDAMRKVLLDQIIAGYKTSGNIEEFGEALAGLDGMADRSQPMIYRRDDNGYVLSKLSLECGIGEVIRIASKMLEKFNGGEATAIKRQLLSKYCINKDAYNAERVFSQLQREAEATGNVKWVQYLTMHRMYRDLKQWDQAHAFFNHCILLGFVPLAEEYLNFATHVLAAGRLEDAFLILQSSWQKTKPVYSFPKLHGLAKRLLAEAEKVGGSGLAKRFVKCVIETGLCKPHSKFLDYFVEVRLASDDVHGAAAEFFNIIKSYGIFVDSGRLLVAIIKQNDDVLLKKVVDAILRFENKWNTKMRVAVAYLDAGKVEEACVLLKIRNSTCARPFYTALIDEDVDSLSELAATERWMEECARNRAIAILLQNGKADKALALIEAVVNFHTLQPVMVWHHFCKAFYELGALNALTTLSKQFPVRVIHASQVQKFTVLAYIDRRDYAKAVELLQQFEQGGSISCEFVDCIDRLLCVPECRQVAVSLALKVSRMSEIARGHFLFNTWRDLSLAEEYDLADEIYKASPKVIRAKLANRDVFTKLCSLAKANKKVTVLQKCLSILSSDKEVPRGVLQCYKDAVTDFAPKH